MIAERTLVCRPAASSDELRAYYRLREEVFVREQRLFVESDVDAVDADPETLHVVAVRQPPGDVVGTVRCYRADDDTWFGGRLAVRRDCRSSRLLVGPSLVRTAEALVQQRGARVFLAYVQLQNVRFFEHLGWVCVGEPREYQGRPHQIMRPSWSAEPSRGAAAGRPPTVARAEAAPDRAWSHPPSGR